MKRACNTMWCASTKEQAGLWEVLKLYCRTAQTRYISGVRVRLLKVRQRKTKLFRTGASNAHHKSGSTFCCCKTDLFKLKWGEKKEEENMNVWESKITLVMSTLPRLDYQSRSSYPTSLSSYFLTSLFFTSHIMGASRECNPHFVFVAPLFYRSRNCQIDGCSTEVLGKYWRVKKLAATWMSTIHIRRSLGSTALRIKKSNRIHNDNEHITRIDQRTPPCANN